MFNVWQFVDLSHTRVFANASSSVKAEKSTCRKGFLCFKVNFLVRREPPPSSPRERIKVASALRRLIRFSARNLQFRFRRGSGISKKSRRLPHDGFLE